MAALHRDSGGSAAATYDPLVPWLLRIKKSLDDLYSTNEFVPDLDESLSECVSIFRHDDRYRNDLRFLKIWFLYLEGCKDFERVYKEIQENQICVGHSSLYEWYALFLEAKGQWPRANSIYQIGISRKAEPFERLKAAYLLFIQRIKGRANKIDDYGTDCGSGTNSINPWSSSFMKDVIEKIKSLLVKYDGYHASNKAYPGKVNLSYLQNSSRNKMLEIGGKKYQIKGCAGQGGFAQVFKAYVNSSPDDVVALKIQSPPFPWEFYMYRQLDFRIPKNQRSCFGSSHRVHLYSDYSILVCDYLSHGTLQDIINSYVVVGKFMEEVLCMYYTIEMLRMLETLHSVGIIHGDFKPDNMLLRYSLDELMEEGFRDRNGPWSHQGLCLVDWGRGIDLQLFPDNVIFKGDCRTSGFCCIEMKEKKPWKFQVDTYGLCVVVHMMLHNNYMDVEKKASPNGGHIHLPRSTFKRYWNVELWKNLFTRLLNSESSNNHTETLKDLRESFQDCICSNPQHLKKLKELLAKQRVSLCSS